MQKTDRVGIMQSYNSKGENCGVQVTFADLDKDVQKDLTDAPALRVLIEEVRGRERRMRETAYQWMIKCMNYERGRA